MSRVLLSMLIMTNGLIMTAGFLSAQPAQTGPQPMTAVSLLEVQTQQELRLSPDGQHLLVVRSQADWDKDRTITHIWRINSDGSGLLQMTNGSEGESSPRWAPDSSRFAFVAKRDGDTEQVYLQANAGGEALQLTDHETSVSDIAWAPDGGSIFFLAEEAKTEEEKEHDKQIGEVYSYDRSFQQHHLWEFDLASKEERRCTEGDWSVLQYHLSDDGTRLVYLAAPTPLFDDQDELEIWIRDLAGEQPARRLTHNQVAEQTAQLSPDGTSVLLVAGASAEQEGYHQGNLFLIPAAGGEVQLLLPDFTPEIYDAVWTGNGQEILLQAGVGVRVELYRLDPESGQLTRLTSGDQTVTSWHLQRSTGQLAWIAETCTSPGDLWLSSDSTQEPQQLTHFAEEVTSQFRLPQTEAVHWQGKDGVEVEGLLTLPLDHQEGTPVPLVVQVHGGPAAASHFRFPGWGSYTPVLAAQGFAVLSPNYRGSTGYGDAFMRDMVGHYFNQADEDVLSGVDALIDRGIADPERLVIMGWSAGGHMTNWLVTQTDRFAAASSGAGAANWISMYGQSDVRIYRTPWFLGSPWQAEAPIDRFLEHSPINYVAQATTPTLILVGENDVRVPMPQSVEMFRGLRANGVETELLVFPGQPHGLRRLKHRLHKINAELTWFHHHVLGEQYEAELPPATEDDSKKKNDNAAVES